MANGSSPRIGLREVAVGTALVLGIMILVSVGIAAVVFAILALVHLLST
jgi:hypothetical protein